MPASGSPMATAWTITPAAAEPAGGPGRGRGVILAVGEEDDGPALRVLLVVEGPRGRVERRAEVGATRPDVARPQRRNASAMPPRFSVKGQRSTPRPAHATTAVRSPPSAPELVDQAPGRLDRRAEPVRHRVLGAHAPAGVDEEDDVVARRQRRGRPAAPPRSCEGQGEAGDRTDPGQRAVARRPSALGQAYPVLCALASGPPRPRGPARAPEPAARGSPGERSPLT